MPRFRYVLLVTFLFSCCLYGERLAVLQDTLSTPVIAEMDAEHLYILDGKNVHIYVYSFKDWKKLASFGKRGEAPSEFLWINHVKSYNGYITVFGEGKLGFFSWDGKYQSEKRIPYATSRYFRLGENFVCKKMVSGNQDYRETIKIVDQDFADVKELMTCKRKTLPSIAQNHKQNAEVVSDFFGFEVEGDRIYIGNTQKGFQVHVFGKKGEKLTEISLPYTPRPITEADKAEFLQHYLRTLGETKYNRILRTTNLIFPEKFPAYGCFTVDGGVLYFLTYPLIKGESELVALSEKGEVKKRIKVPIREYSEYFCVFQGMYYYLQENENTDNWELHGIRILDTNMPSMQKKSVR